MVEKILKKRNLYIFLVVNSVILALLGLIMLLNGFHLKDNFKILLGSISFVVWVISLIIYISLYKKERLKQKAS